MDENRLTLRHTILLVAVAIVLGGPAMAMVELQMLPGRWLEATQDRLFGYHISEVSIAVLMGVEILLVTAIIVPLAVVILRVTGKTVVELFRRNG